MSADLHPTVTAHKALRAVARDRAKLAKAREAHRERIRKAEAERDRQVAKWRQDSRDALLRGQEPPPEPDTNPAAAGVHPEQTFIAEAQRLDLAEREAMTHHAAELRAVVRDRADELTAEARRLVDQLQALAREASQLAASDVAIRRVQGERSEPAGSLDAAALAAVMRRGGDVLAPAPARPSSGSFVSQPPREREVVTEPSKPSDFRQPPTEDELSGRSSLRPR